MSLTDSMHLREQLRILERKLGVLGKGDLSCGGLTIAQCHAVVEIGRSKSISLNVLAKLLDLDNSTMSRTVNNLVNSGLVVRDLNTKDRRFITIRLTKNGIQVFESIEASMEVYFKNIFSQIPENKREQVLESLQVLLDAFH